MSSTLYIDVRRPEEYSTGHIPGAININLEDEPQFVAAVCELVLQHDEVILYCHSSMRSSYAQTLLANKHGVAVGNLDGGLTFYQGQLETDI
ncbi:MAG: pyridine nucleotide-disulfide oxidoreductase [Candidatus Parcubacteria bacterium]|jgi:rhodanese-related sulfurtransferase